MSLMREIGVIRSDIVQRMAARLGSGGSSWPWCALCFRVVGVVWSQAVGHGGSRIRRA